jgi:hypothetical protein
MSIHIGSIIKNHCDRNLISAAQLSKLLNLNQATIYKIERSANLNTKMLFNNSVALKHDFFQYFQSALGENPNEKLEKLKKDYDLLQMENDLLKKMLKLTNSPT